MRTSKVLLCSLLLAMSTIATASAGVLQPNEAHRPGLLRVVKRDDGVPNESGINGGASNEGGTNEGGLNGGSSSRSTLPVGTGEGGAVSQNKLQTTDTNTAADANAKHDNGKGTNANNDGGETSTTNPSSLDQTQSTDAVASGGKLELEVLAKAKYDSLFEMNTFVENNLNYADNGLLAEMIYNRAFQTAGDAEFTRPASDEIGSGSLAGWMPVGQVHAELVKEKPLSAELPASAKLTFDPQTPANNTKYDGTFGLRNRGFWGMPVSVGDNYNASFWIRADNEASLSLEYGLFDYDANTKWGGGTGNLKLTDQWQKVTYTFNAETEAPNTQNVFALIFKGADGAASKGKPPAVYINLVSVFPPTWSDTVIRKDSAQAFLEFAPMAVRAPGGNDMNGFSPASRFKWNTTIGPLEHRPGRAGNWAGWNTDGLGVVEMYNFFSRLGAKLIVGLFAGTYDSSKAVSKDEMGPIVQENIEFLRFLLDRDGPFAKMRVEAGGPHEPYAVDGVMVGNENAQTALEGYEDRFGLIEAAIRKQFFDSKDSPNFDIIATAPVKVANGRRNALNTLNNPRYGTPQNFVDFYHEYDKADRSANTVYYNMEFSAINNGESSSGDLWNGPGRLEYTTLKSSLAEGVFLLGLERNGDVCGPAAYAPQLAIESEHRAHQSTPGLLIFDACNVVRSSSFLVQQAFGKHRLDKIHDFKVASGAKEGQDILEQNNIFFSVGTDKEGRYVVKLINYNASAQSVTVKMPGKVAKATQYVVTGKSSRSSNTIEKSDEVTASSSGLNKEVQGDQINLLLKPYSMNAIRATVAQ